MNPGQFKRSGKYLETGVEGLGLYEDLDKVDESKLQDRIQQLIKMNQ
jgi:hypothetical protein